MWTIGHLIMCCGNERVRGELFLTLSAHCLITYTDKLNVQMDCRDSILPKVYSEVLEFASFHGSLR